MIEIDSPAPGILVLTLRRRGARAGAALFTLVSAVAVFTLTVQLVGTLGSARFDSLLNWFGVVVFYAIALGFVGAGAYMSTVLLRPARLVVDQPAQTLTLDAPNGLRWQRRDIPYFGVAQVTLEEDSSHQSVAFLLLLRSGEQVALGAVSIYAREQASLAAAALRSALP